MSWLDDSADGARLTVRVTPRASRNAVTGVEDGWLRVRLQAPPVEGQANAALLAFLADALDVSKRQVVLTQGGTSRVKHLHIAGLTAAQVRVRLGIAGFQRTDAR